MVPLVVAERTRRRGVHHGGPWHRDPGIFKEADQLSFYALNDMPQGEFWQDETGRSTRQFAENDLVDRFFMRGAVSAGHVYGKRRISAESFTHMRRHWSMSPSVLRTPVDAPWSVSFAYHRLNHARHLPKPRTMARLEEWTASDDPDLRFFSGTATYETTLDLDPSSAFLAAGADLSVGALPTGVAHVYVNDVDCGTVWCAPWTAKVPAWAFRERNRIVIRYTNNWTNRLIGDCSLEPADRVTTSCLQLLKGGRVKPDGSRLNVYSGYCSEDPLQKSGLLGPVTVR